MIPDPLHPAIVHFPMVLMFILPIAALIALWLIRRGAPVRLIWLVPVAFSAALAASALVAKETGEDQEDRVEDVVGKRPVDEHKEAAERFVFLSAGVLVLAMAGLIKGRVGGPARLLATVASLGLVVAGYQVGKLGGEIVYGNGTSTGLVTASGAHLTGPGGEGGGERGEGAEEAGH
jgi:hypothetical protein